MAGASGDPTGGAISGINVTPLVDVMLVLLVIFMVTAPMMQSGVNVNLPQTSSSGAALNTGEAPLVVSMTRDGALYLNDTEMDLQALTTKLTAIHKEKPTQIVYLRADQAASYGLVVGVISALKAAGIEQLGMITEPGRGSAMVESEDGSIPPPLLHRDKLDAPFFRAFGVSIAVHVFLIAAVVGVAYWGARHRPIIAENVGIVNAPPGSPLLEVGPLAGGGGGGAPPAPSAVNVGAPPRPQQDEAAAAAAAAEAARRAAEEAARRQAAEEAARQQTAADTARQAAEQEAARDATEEAAKQKAVALEAKKAEDARLAAVRLEEAEKKKATDDAAKKQAAEDAAKKKAADDAAKKKAADAAAKKKATEEAAAKKAADTKKAAEAEAKLKAEEAAKAKAAADAKAVADAKAAAQAKMAEAAAAKAAQDAQLASAPGPGAGAIGAGPGPGGGGLGGGGGGGGGGDVRGIEFVRYYEQMIARIRENWVWVGEDQSLAVTVRFSIQGDGRVVNVQRTASSGNQLFDESVEKAVRGVRDLGAPPQQYARDFSDVEVVFRAKDLAQ